MLILWDYVGNKFFNSGNKLGVLIRINLIIGPGLITDLAPCRGSVSKSVSPRVKGDVGGKGSWYKGVLWVSVP